MADGGRRDALVTRHQTKAGSGVWVEEVCGERGEKLRERSAMPQGSGSAREVWCERIMTGRRGLR